MLRSDATAHSKLSLPTLGQLSFRANPVLNNGVWHSSLTFITKFPLLPSLSSSLPTICHGHIPLTLLHCCICAFHRFNLLTVRLVVPSLKIVENTSLVEQYCVTHTTYLPCMDVAAILNCCTKARWPLVIHMTTERASPSSDSWIRLESLLKHDAVAISLLKWYKREKFPLFPGWGVLVHFL